MSLRTKWTIGLAVLMTAVFALTALATRSFIEREQNQEVDQFLTERMRVTQGLIADFNGRGGAKFGDRSPPTAGGRLGQFDTITQVIDTDGSVLVREGRVELPIPERSEDLAVGAIEISTETVDGTPYRVATAELPDGLSLSVARDLSENDDVLRGVQRRIFFAGLIGVVAAALAGWFGAGRAIKPIRQVTVAAEGVASEKDLASPLPVIGNDELARLSGSFNTMIEALRTSREQQRRLVMDASHELRTPLTSLRTSIELLETGITDTETTDRLMANASSELKELSALVNELVDLATDRSIDTEARQPVDLAVVANAVAEKYRSRHEHTISVTVSGNNEAVAAMESIERCVSNLVANAAKFTPSNSEITIVVSDTTVTVSDTGSGFDEDDLPHVFDRFYRAETARPLPGSGLGLAIVKQIVSDHGGTVFAKNRPEGGASVGFTLPT